MPKYRVLNHQGRSMSASYISISSGRLSGPIGTANVAVLVDARIDEVVSADPRLIPGAVRRSRDVQDWASRLMGRCDRSRGVISRSCFKT